MEKITRRFLFGDLFNLQAYEEYFSKMSKKGLHLQRLGKFFMYFKEGNPDNINYRIDMVEKDEKEIVIRKHRENGWNFVGEKDAFLIFSSLENSGLEELYDTPEAQRLALEKAKDELFSETNVGFFISIIALIFIIIVTYKQIKFEGGFYFLLIKPQIILPIISVSISLFSLYRKRWHINRILKVLKANKFLNHYSNYYSMKGGFVTRWTLIILILISLFYKVYKDTYTNLSDIENMAVLPVVNISDIETMDYEWENYTFINSKDDIDYGNYIYQTWNLLVPKEYNLVETAVFKDNSESQLFSNYYLGRSESLVKGLEKNILTREEERYSNKLNKVLEEGDLVCYGTEEGNHSIVLCRKGKQLIFLKYYDGAASLDEIIQAIIGKL